MFNASQTVLDFKRFILSFWFLCASMDFIPLDV